MRRYAPNQHALCPHYQAPGSIEKYNHHALCPHYQAPGSIEKYDTQGIRPYALCVNNIVAGNRKIPGTKYVIYQGPQYVNG